MHSGNFLGILLPAAVDEISVARDDPLDAFVLAAAAFLGRYGPKTLPEGSRGRFERTADGDRLFGFCEVSEYSFRLTAAGKFWRITPTVREAPVVWYSVKTEVQRRDQTLGERRSLERRADVNGGVSCGTSTSTASSSALTCRR